MRESLTIFAIALIVVLSALLVGPYLVDWNRQRDWLAAKLSHAVGAQVRIAGPIDVKLLPRPIFRAAQVSIDGAGPQAPRFSAARLDAELSLNGLLQGAAEFVDARLTEPRIEVTLRRDGSIVAPSLRTTNADRFQFSHVSIERGSLAVLDEAGQPTAVLSDLTADGEAETLFGPVKLNGTAETAQGAVTFRLNTGSYGNGKLRVHLAADHKGGWEHGDADGVLSFGSSGQKGAHPTSMAFDGALRLTGEIKVADGAAPVPWALTSTGNTADIRNLAAPAIELRAGADARALVATGSALFSLGDTPAGIARLRARQLDLDHLTVPPDVAPDTPRPSATQWLAALRAALDAPMALPFGLKLDFAIDAVTAGDLTLTDASLSADMRPGALPHITAALSGPNATRAVLDGTIEAGSVPAFHGRVDIATRDVAAVATWVAPFAPGLRDQIGEAYQGQAGALKGAVDVSAVGLVARNATLLWAGTTLEGSLSATAGTATDRPRLFADLKADSFDPAQWPGVGPFLGLTAPFDFNLGLTSDAVTLARSDAGVAQTGRLALHAVKKGDEITVDRFTLAGFGDAAIDATAFLRADKRLHAEGQVSAGDIARSVAALKQIVPDLPADALSRRGPALSPLQLGFKADAILGDGGAVEPVDLSLAGTAAATRFTLGFAPTAHTAGSGEATLVIDAPDGEQVLQQAGWAGSGSLGPLHVEARGQGSLADGFASKVTAALPKASASFSGQVGQTEGQGWLTFEASDLGPLLRATGVGDAAAGRSASMSADLSWNDTAVGLHGLKGRLVGSTVSGDLDVTRNPPADHAAPLVTGSMSLDVASLDNLFGLGVGIPSPKAGSVPDAWSTAPFGAAPTWPTASIGLHVGSLDVWPGVVGRDTGLTLQVRPGAATLADLSTHVLGGTAGGSVTVRRIGSGASVAGHVEFDKLAAALPDLAGRLSGKLSVAGSGPSPSALVGSLAGDGTLALAGATIPRLAPAALSEVSAKLNGDTAVIEEAPVKEALARGLDKGSALLGDVSAPATIAAGTVRVNNLKVALPEATVAADAALDLANLTLVLRASMTAAATPQDWKGDPPQITVSWKGPLLSPTREVDVGGFLNGLAARAIAREQERIDLMKDDLRERAFFARRLKQIEAERQVAHDAAIVPKPVPQPPSRPTDIRLPKPPDVGPPALLQSVRPSVQQDGISQFLNGMPEVSKMPSRLNSAGSGDVGSGSRSPGRAPAPVADPGLY